MNSYFVTESNEGWEQAYHYIAETAEDAALAYVAEGCDNEDLTLVEVRVFEPKLNVKSYTFDVTPRAVEVKKPRATKGDSK